MQITTILNSHGHPDVTKDTLESIKTHMTKDIVVVVDGAAWKEMLYADLNTHLLEGFWHKYPKSPYRNIILGLLEASKKWPKTDWYCYLEYDCLVANDTFKVDLELANRLGYICLGTNHRINNIKLPFLEKILGEKLKTTPNYLLGCCVFYSGRLINNLHGFFERFLYYTNEFKHGFFPDYEKQGGYDFAEHLMPTLAAHYGGKVGGFSRWGDQEEAWTEGNYKKYPIRFRPDLSVEENYTEATIFHPIKNYDDPIRQYHREKRAR